MLCVVCAFSVCRLCMCVACALSLWSTDGQPWSCRDTSSAPILRGWCQLAIAHRPALGVKNSGALSTASALPCKIIHTSRAGSLVCSVCTILRREGTVHNIRQYIVYLRVYCERAERHAVPTHWQDAWPFCSLAQTMPLYCFRPVLWVNDTQWRFVSALSA